MNKDIFTLLGGFLSATLLFLTSIGVSYDWFTQESIDSFVFMVASGVAFLVALFSIWKNTYVTKKSKKQKELLKKEGLK